MEKLKIIRDHLADWLERAAEIAGVVPQVHETLEQVEWQVAALSERPTELGQFRTP